MPTHGVDQPISALVQTCIVHGARAQPEGAGRLFILLVDDEPPMLRVMARTLESVGFECVCCRSGVEALDALQHQVVHCVVSDIGLPGMSGFELLRSAHERVPGLPVVLISGDTTEMAAQEASALGACAFLPKPLDTQEFVAVVRAAAAQAVTSRSVSLGR